MTANSDCSDQVKGLNAILVLFFLTFPSYASSADLHQGYLVGTGQKSCGSFLSALHSHATDSTALNWQGTSWVPVSEMYEQWLWGFVSAESFHLQLKSDTDGPGITQWVAHWCESHGDESLAKLVPQVLMSGTPS